MKITENRPVAWVVLIVCVLISVILLGGGSVAKERAALVTLFNSGTDTASATRSSMDSYLDSAAEQARVMANEAIILLGEDNETAAEMLSICQTVSDSDDLDARYDAYIRLKEDSDKLYNAIYEKFDKTATTNFKHAYDIFGEEGRFIKQDATGYRAKAAAFNSELKNFPESLIASLRGVRTLNSFGAD